MKIFIDHFKTDYENNPIMLVDVGASGGLSKPWQHVDQFLKVIGFEPDKDEFKRLSVNNNGKRIYLNSGLSSAKSQSRFFVTQKQQTSSTLEPNAEFLNQFPDAVRFNVKKTLMMEVDTLDNQLKENNITDIDFIKIDAQGGAMLILKGAQNTLNQPVFGCEIEVEYAPLYKGQTLFCDVDQLMRTYSFQLLDLQSFRWKREKGRTLGRSKGQLVFANALYLRDPESYVKQLEALKGENYQKAKMLKAISICILYGYFDYAYQLFECGRKLFSQEDQLIIEYRIKKGYQYHNIWEWFKHRMNLGALYFHTINALRREWTSSDHRLGNW